MICRYLRKIVRPGGVVDNEAWLCNYGLKGPKASGVGIRHCPFKDGDEVCLFPGGPFDPNSNDDEPSVA